MDNDHKLTSIIILTHNGLKFTKECIRSIFQYTKEDFELVIVDNGSTDGTIEFLKTLPKAKLIINKNNNGFAGGCNQGISVAEGEQLLLLNNDTVVTKDWLGKLLSCYKQHSDEGLVGPRSNFVISHQAVSKIPYQNMDEMQEFAADWSKKHDKQHYEVDHLSGLCMLFNRTLINEIGWFDERFYPGYYEDTDFCLRARVKEKKLLVANDVFIHHHGSSSFKIDRRSRNLHIKNNEKEFFEKWNMQSMNDFINVIDQEKPFRKERHYIPF